jgi:3-deoxy-D-manno-octulosonic-acid transferase
MADRFPSWRLRLTLWGYSALWVIGLPAVLLYLWSRGRREALYRAHLGERFGTYPAFAPGAVWVHAVSLGELRSAVPMIRALLNRGEHIVTTHFTPAGRREVERVFAADIAAGRLRVAWVPFEFGFAYRRFFKAFSPKCGLVMEIEIWPRMIMAARKAGVPLFMCNAQYPSKSYARDTKTTGMRAQVMRGFAGALVKSDLQAQRFASVGVSPIRVTGELRFDQPMPPHLLAAGVAVRAWLGAQERLVVTIASAVQGEDDLYIAAIRGLRTAHLAKALPPPLFIYVPRKPERFDEVARMLKAAGLAVGKRSDLLDATLAPTDSAAPQIDVLVGDSLGEMYAYLAMADLVIVGGGFTPKGAHNIIEPLALRKPVLTGPETWTIEFPFAEAKAAGVARSVPDGAALLAALQRSAAVDPTKIDAFFNTHSGATTRTIAALDQLLTSR